MTKILIAAASLALMASAANACEYLRSAKAKVDQTVVASIVADGQPATSTQMSTSADPVLLPGQPAPGTEDAVQK